MAGVSDLVSYNPPQTSGCLLEMIQSIINSTTKEAENKIQDIQHLIQEFGDNTNHNSGSHHSSSSLTSFGDISVISSGGFGVVFQGRHRLDGQRYAIKVIPITLSPEKDTFTDILLSKIREVRYLAQLHHPNIIRYHNSWMHFCNTDSPVEFLQDLIITHRIDASQKWSLAEYSLDSRDNDSSLEESSITTSRDDSNLVTTPKGKGITRSSSDLVLSGSHTSLGKIHLILYLQMELMGQTLSEWREANSPPDYMMYHVFGEVLKGVEYLHQTTPPVIHCDLKPDNILIRTKGSLSSDEDTSPVDKSTNHQFKISPTNQVVNSYNCPFEVKIADFGLVSVIGHPWSPLPTEGTLTYKAPELQEGKPPTPASDIYSLGVIFYEMINHFDTAMERAQTLTDFKSGKITTKTLLDKMVHKDPFKRPSVQEVRYYLEGVYLQDRVDYHTGAKKTKLP